MIESGKKILRKLNAAGYEAYFVGGFVRDQFLGIESTDIDLTTNALPEQVEVLFDKTIPTGKKYGTITVRMNKQSFEVTTYRLDQEYRNYRQPSQIKFSNELKEDLVRRDFTMNALAQDIKGSIIDLFNGKEDIKNHIIRAIDDPYKRFEEDALRILRAIRFVGKLNFTIEETTYKAMIDKSHLLSKIPCERIIQELTLILEQKHIGPVYEIMNKIQLGKVFPELKLAFDYLKGHQENISIEELFALALFQDKKLDRNKWRFSNKQVHLIENMKALMGFLLNHELTPILAYNHDEETMLSADDLLKKFFNYKTQKDTIINLYKALTLQSFKDLKINGQDLKTIVEDERHIGKIINSLIEAVLLEKLVNEKKQLLDYAKKLAEELNETRHT